MHKNLLLSSRSLSTARVFFALAFLPLLLIALSGIFIFLDLTSRANNEAIAHTQNSAKLLSDKTNAYISNRTHAVELMAGEKAIQNLALAPNADNKDTAKKTLRRYCQTLSASLCYVMDQQGFMVTDNQPPETTLAGNNYGFRDYFLKAITGEPTMFPALGASTQKRGLYFSHPISSANRIIGVAVIKFLPDEIEKSYQGLSGKTLLVDSNGIIFAASEPDYLFKSLFPIEQALRKKIIDSRQFGDQIPDSFLKKFVGQDQVVDSQDNKFLIERTDLTSIPGWKIVYLLPPEHFAKAPQNQTQAIILILIILFFLIILIVVSKLFINLKQTLQESDDYRFKLEESKDRLQQFEEITTEAIIIRDQLKILDFNKRSEELFQLSREELLKSELPALFANNSARQTIELMLSNSEKPYKADIQTPSGEELPVIITDRPTTWNGQSVQVTSLKDERRHKAVQQKLQASESRFRQLSDLISEGLLVFSEDTAVDANDALCSIIGLRKEDLIGMPMSQIFPEDTLKSLISSDHSLIEQEFDLPRQDGTLFPAELSTASMEFEDGLYTVLSIRDITSQKEQEEHILYQAQYDLLTHIPNRFLARDRAEHAMTNADSTSKKMVLMFIDLDGFKKVNDSLGHDVGDVLLQLASRRFKSCLQPNDTLARHGGDEFIIIIEDVEEPEDTELLLEKILHQFSNPFIIDNKELIVTASIGVAVYPNDAQTYPALLRAADIGMYKAKKDGRNTFHFYTQEMNNIAVRQLQLDSNLRFALEQNEFHLVFQPLISGGLNAGKVVGAEALLRWESEELGNVTPDEFIPLTENTGLIIPIGRWVLLEACKQAKVWIDQGCEDFTISVNVSPRQFTGNQFIHDLNYAIGNSGLPPQNLNLEVTEGLLIQASAELNHTLDSLSEMGVKISMDDFGTGYSSLRYLQTFPFNNLKIDRTFINNLPSNKDSKILVAAIIAMAHKLGLSVTAEGIETIEQFNYMNILDCDMLQGYYIGKPMHANAFTEFLFSTRPGGAIINHYQI